MNHINSSYILTKANNCFYTLLNSDLQLETSNEKFKELFHQQQDETCVSFPELFAEPYHQQWKNILKKVQQSRGSVETVTIPIETDKVRLNIDWNICTIPNSDNTIRGIEILGVQSPKPFNEEASPVSGKDGIADENGIAKNITESIAGHTALTRQERRFKLVLNNLKKVLNSSLDIICVVDHTGKFTRVSLACKTILGYEPRELVGKNIIDFVYEEDAAPTIEANRSTINGFSTTNFENRYYKKDGSLATLIWSSKWEEEDQKFYCIARDVTEKKAAEIASQKNIQQFEVVFNYATIGIVLTDGNGRISNFNKYAETQFGYTRDEVLGKPIEILIPQAVHDKHETYRKNFRQHPQNRVMGAGMELYARKKNGIEFPVEISLSHYRLNDNEYVIAFVIDITLRKQNEDLVLQQRNNLEKRAKELLESNAELERFAYVASHDLQEPLRMVSSFLQLLNKRYKDKLDQKAHEYIAYAVDGAERMKRLILDLLEYSRVNSSVIAKEDVDVNEVIDDLRLTYKNLLHETNGTINSEKLPLVKGNKTQILQLFQNLIGNAFKYKSNNAPVIDICCKEDNNFYRFSVSDNGIGIDPKFFQKIFIIFQRLHQREQYSGTGIGLAICKKIIEKHGGKIWVNSTPGQGSTFYFTLPKAK